MAMLRGERFDLNDDNEDQPTSVSSYPGTDFIKDVIERSDASSASVAPPVMKSKTGFPQHKKRSVPSNFKQQRSTVDAPSPSTPSGDNDQRDERAGIDAENKRKLASMSSADIERERTELLGSLPPSLLEQLMRRANVDDEQSASETQDPKPTPQVPTITTTPAPQVSEMVTAHHTNSENVDLDSVANADGIASQNSQPEDPPTPAFHFPPPPCAPELDPASPSFLKDLHTKYFPELPADPSKLAWMDDSAEAPGSKSYSTDLDEVAVNAIRFSFRGAIIPPSTASQIPVTKGLHHHGDAPDSAGYTVPELAHLSRSSFPTQRCIAFSVLGRMMYRLGKGHFGDSRSDLVKGLWQCLEQGRIIDTLQEESKKEGGHASAKAYATEALWLWQRGGGKRVPAQ